MGRKADTIILPLELLRQLKSSEFYDAHEYHQWQRRQLKILEAGLLLHPAVAPEKLNSASLQLKEVIRFSEMKPIDTNKNSEAMRNLCSSVIALAWRSPNGTTSEVCHWADGFPLNIHLYLALLQSIFDLREETVVLDEVDELIELMKKTWPTLGINRMIHNVCFTWVLFHQYIVTGQVEPDLIRATLAMLVEVANDAKRLDRESCYMKVVSAVLASMQGWAEKKLLDYHESFDKGTVENMENILSLALSTTKIINEDVSSMVGSGVGLMERDSGTLISRMDGYIRSSMRNTFTKVTFLALALLVSVLHSQNYSYRRGCVERWWAEFLPISCPAQDESQEFIMCANEQESASCNGSKLFAIIVPFPSDQWQDLIVQLENQT